MLCHERKASVSGGGNETLRMQGEASAGKQPMVMPGLQT
jgi:hypothetical protein